MENIKKLIQECSLMLRIKYDKKNNIAYGRFRDFDIVINEKTEALVKYINVNFSACDNDGYPLRGFDISSIELPANTRVSIDRFRINITLMIKNKNTFHDISLATRNVMDYVLSLGGKRCDELGSVEYTTLWKLRGEYCFLSEESANTISKNVSTDISNNKQTNENIILGIVGGLIGAALGAILVLLLAQLGYVTSLTAFALGFATIFGYKKFAGKYSIISVILCMIISIGVTYFTFLLSTTIDVYPALKGTFLEDISFWECFSRIKEIMELAKSIDVYNHNLVMMMMYSIIGAIFSNWAVFKADGEKYELKKID